MKRSRIYFVAKVGKMHLDMDLSHALLGTFSTERELVHRLGLLVNAGDVATSFAVYFLEVGTGAIEKDEDMEIEDLYPTMEWRQRYHESPKEKEEACEVQPLHRTHAGAAGPEDRCDPGELDASDSS